MGDMYAENQEVVKDFLRAMEIEGEWILSDTSADVDMLAHYEGGN